MADEQLENSELSSEDPTPAEVEMINPAEWPIVVFMSDEAAAGPASVQSTDTPNPATDNPEIQLDPPRLTQPPSREYQLPLPDDSAPAGRPAESLTLEAAVALVLSLAAELDRRAAALRETPAPTPKSDHSKSASERERETSRQQAADQRPVNPAPSDAGPNHLAGAAERPNPPEQSPSQEIPRLNIFVQLADAKALFDDVLRGASREMALLQTSIAQHEIESHQWRRDTERLIAMQYDY